MTHTASLTATIRYPRDERIIALFAAEDKDVGRGKYSVELTADAVVFSVTAQDATAMRAAVSTIRKRAASSRWMTTRI